VTESEALAQRAQELAESSHGKRSLSQRKTRLRAGSDGAALRSQLVAVEVDGRAFEVNLVTPEPGWAAVARRRRGRRSGLYDPGAGTVTSPMQGTVLKVDVADGDRVVNGQVVCVVEAMKMENEIAAHRDGVVRDLRVAAGEPIASGDVVCHIVDE